MRNIENAWDIRNAREFNDTRYIENTFGIQNGGESEDTRDIKSTWDRDIHNARGPKGIRNIKRI